VVAVHPTLSQIRGEVYKTTNKHGRSYLS
jgi:hypothetical protein